MNRLKDKVAIVTASTKGIGLAIVKAFAKEGAVVYMTTWNKEIDNSIIDELDISEGKVKLVYFDAREEESYESMVDEVLENEGRIDILVNNFGGTNPRYDRDIINGNYEDFIKGVEVNLRSVFLTSHLVIKKAMSIQKSGSIVNIGSIAGLIPDLTQCAYGTSKAGINHLTKMIAGQTASLNIRCNAVCPGMTATDAVKDNLTEDYMGLFLKHTPLGRMAEPEEIAAAVLYFASDESAFTTGQVIAVSGGYGLSAPTYGDIINGNMNK